MKTKPRFMPRHEYFHLPRGQRPRWYRRPLDPRAVAACAKEYYSGQRVCVFVPKRPLLPLEASR